MNARIFRGTPFVGAVVLTAAAATAQAPMAPAPMAMDHTMVTADKIVWGPAPPGLPPGSMAAVLSGNPGAPGTFTIRAKLPAGYRIAPHWHPTDEHVTVLSGAIAMGTGEKWDDKALMAMPAGAFAAMASNTRHYLFAKSESIIQVHGTGPFSITYVNPADDPRAAAMKK